MAAGEIVQDGVVRSDLGPEGLVPPMESFWARMQVELINRKRWRTRLELANAIFEYLEIFHNRQRRHSSLGMVSPIEYERRHSDNQTRDQAS